MNQSQPEGQEALRDKVQDCERQIKDLKREIELTQKKLNFY